MMSSLLPPAVGIRRSAGGWLLLAAMLCIRPSFAAGDLAAAAAAANDSAARLFTIGSQPFFLGADLSVQAGTLTPATELIVIRRDGDRVQATLGGWQQEGADGVIYAAVGKRIISASLNETARAQLKIIGDAADQPAGQIWHQVALDVWLPKAALLDDRQKIWRSAAGSMAANCGGCHALPATRNFTANQWIGVMKGMAPRTSLDKEQIRLLTQYVQQHAGDMPADAAHP
ncbi:hypothetical protein [Acerihabitans arboris]|uniref:Uncharacterized protein n=1 Tax=Acerihabitans arboris TaxID=2691583 RepID=A0A845SKS3_9GAMM|nr:hypothetical protein [Acerihabitans arboris]NDL63982.1 hypothetical protein [Acerihabitans arboris]